ncbi:MAG: acetate kinase [Lactobacillus iners]|uniref:acetate/propionate family kinase n=1 Tax=Lactobacillus iners TaxID=147802 RepID=UPI002A0DD006|nr:acetate kinase [Lactobacillus iners]MCT7678320.1 acetate kinase [Lactobacillus iners]MCT7683375.1 acetate kinase [Lactobacillus iners]MCT7778266.1 acetate kinase [Lactobacillus iners]MCT7892880.1 acetate kinase [Lactobacillus iners]
MKKILAINSGSSSFKYKLFNYPSEEVVAQGQAQRIGLAGSTFSLKLADGSKYESEIKIPDHKTAIQLLLTWLPKYNVINDLKEIAGIGHRVVAGGEIFSESALIDKEKLQQIYDLSDYAPLHNPYEADGIRDFMQLLPGVPQVAVFDTSFHHTLDPVHYLYSLPYKYYEKYRARKYGAHGTSVRYVSHRAAELLNKPLNTLKMIVCHLGNGASITAIKDGKSYDTSMGFSPVAGITMSTRSGDIDPSVLQYVMKKENISDFNKMINILNNKSGILGISDYSPDMRDIRKRAAAGDVKAKLAKDIFVNRIIKYIGSYYVDMGGLDALVFTAGIGENESLYRQAIVDKLSVLGLKIDEKANSVNGEKVISAVDSKAKILIIPTNEELVIAGDVVRLAKINK